VLFYIRCIMISNRMIWRLKISIELVSAHETDKPARTVMHAFIWTWVPL
jgi:hypothetical protein